jgi:hypothetical protein
MAIEKHMLRLSKFVFVILLCFAFSITGCGPSYKERQAREDTERKELKRKNESKT